ncbi:MAG: hypothetical protein AAF998_04975 [Bacteroidota bacterium]
MPRKLPISRTIIGRFLLLGGMLPAVLGCEPPVERAARSSPVTAVQADLIPSQSWNPGEYDRSTIQQRRAAKLKAGQPLVAHVLVPLCDNAHQGIVPVNASLGNGQNPRTNLYWGAGYGIKTHFKRATDWEFIAGSPPEAAHLLDRAVFRKQFAGGTTLYLIADAYDGAHMKTCLQDFFRAAAGHSPGKIAVSNDSLPIGSDADLLILNGHNGLMDLEVRVPENRDGLHRDAAVIACYSYPYFEKSLARTGAYPLIMTTHLLAPEAYVLRALLDHYGAGENGAEIRTAVGAAYHKYQKCGLKGATRLFRTGWKPAEN